MPRAPMDCRKPRSYWGPEKAMEIYNRIDDIDAIIVKLDGTVVYSKGMQRGQAVRRRQQVARSDRDLSKCDDFRLLAGLQIIAD